MKKKHSYNTRKQSSGKISFVCVHIDDNYTLLLLFIIMVNYLLRFALSDVYPFYSLRNVADHLKGTFFGCLSVAWCKFMPQLFWQHLSIIDATSYGSR